MGQTVKCTILLLRDLKKTSLVRAQTPDLAKLWLHTNTQTGNAKDGATQDLHFCTAFKEQNQKYLCLLVTLYQNTPGSAFRTNNKIKK